MLQLGLAMDEKIEYNCNNGGCWYLCPDWWRNFVIELDILHNDNRKEIIRNTLETWNITTNISDKSSSFDDLVITFPSNEVYVQFMLTYS